MGRCHVTVCLAALMALVFLEAVTSQQFRVSDSVQCSSESLDDRNSSLEMQFCFQRFNCSSSSYSTFPTLQATVIGEAATNFTVTHDQQDVSVFYLCTNQSSGDIPDGTYKFMISITITGGTNVTDQMYLNVTLEVGTAGAAPEIQLANSTVAVLENAAVNSTILTFHVTDPSATDSPAEIDVHLDGGADKLALRTKVEGSEYELFVSNALNATSKSTYDLQITVTNQCNLTASANLSVTVLDVNEAPVCGNKAVTVIVSKTTSSGTVVGNITCWDWDVRSDFRNITYSPSSLFSTLQISPNGSIVMISNVSNGLVSSSANVSVFAPGYPNVSTSVTVKLVIEGYTGPNCSFPENISFPETATIGTCSNDTAYCTGVLPATRVTYNYSTGGLFSAALSSVNSTLQARVCVADSLMYKVGNYSTTVDLYSPLGNTSITGYIRISGVNQKPYFQRPAYFRTVMENVSVGYRLADVRVATNITDVGGATDIVVYDLDLGTDDFKIKNISFSLRIEYVNGTQFENHSVTPIQLVSTSVRVMAPLRPDLVYLLTLTAIDGQGLTGNTTLNITVQDINQSPECQPAGVVPLDLLTPVPRTVYILSCTDSDFSQTFRTLTYGMYTEWNYTLFNVSSGTGEVVLVSPVPRSARDLHLNVFASDGGGLRANVTLIFNVSGNYTPVCQPAYVPPGAAWTRGQCFRVFPFCSDPSMLNGDNSSLKYSFSGNFLNAFTVNMSLGNSSYAEFCYLNYTDATYQLELRVDNGRDTYLWTHFVTVVYLKAMPRFTDTMYKATVNETAAVDAVVLTVHATVNGSVVDMIYTLLGNGDFQQFFQMNNQTGEVRVLKGLRSIAGMTLRADISAEDPITRLNTTVPIKVEIEDLNDPPVCNSTTVSATVPWNLAPQQVVARVMCHDDDPTISFSRLTYSIRGDEGNETLWGINSSTGEVFLTSRSFLSPNVTSFSRNVTVTDGTYSLVIQLLLTVQRVYIANVSISISPSRTFDGFIIENSDVTATCTARTPGANDTTFKWSLSGSTRLLLAQPKVSENENDPFRFTSQLVISGIRLSENGTLFCLVSSANAGASDSANTTLIVVGAMTTSLSVSSQVVPANTRVNFTCSRNAGYMDNWTAVLSCNNLPEQVKTVAKEEKKVVFAITVNTITVTCTCKANDSKGLEESKDETVVVLLPGKKNCSRDDRWPETPAEATVYASCASSKSGRSRRTCDVTGTWEDEDTRDCVNPELKALNDTLRDLVDGVSNSSTSGIIQTLANTTSDSQSLSQGDVMLTVDIMLKLSNLSFQQGQGPGETALKSFTATADNVLQAPPGVWNRLQSEAFSLLLAVDKMGEAAAGHLDNTTESVIHAKSSNIMLQVGKTSTDITFPNKSSSYPYPDWIKEAENSAYLSQDAFPTGVDEVRYSAVIYRNLSNIFPQKSENSSNLTINSAIMTLTLAGGDKIKSSVNLTFEHLSSNFSSTSCQFVDFSNSASGRWSEAGCTVVESDRRKTKCSCNHLTNFALLMSPYRPADIHARILAYFTYIGCGISIVGLLITIVVYAVLWRYVKSDRSIILVNLCVVLLLAYVTFLSGVDRTENQDVCKAITAILHYLFLVVFFLMLSEGLNIFIAIVIVFQTKSFVGWLLALAYGVPVVIVAVSLGVRFDGYSSRDFCWLSLSDGLLWAFVGPALATLLANFVFVFIVIRALVRSTTFVTRDKREKAKSVVKAICVMTPVLGLTWVFSVLSVNKETIVFQYLFLAFNSLQGFLIFVFHCLLSKQVQEGMQHRRRRYLASSSSNDKSLSHSNNLPEGSVGMSHTSQTRKAVDRSSFDTSETSVAPLVSQTSVSDPEYSEFENPEYVDYTRDAETGQTEEIGEPWQGLPSATVRSGQSTKTQVTVVSSYDQSLRSSVKSQSSAAADLSGVPLTSLAVGVKGTPSGTHAGPGDHLEAKAGDGLTKRAVRAESRPMGFTSPVYVTGKWDCDTYRISRLPDRNVAQFQQTVRDGWEQAGTVVTSRLAVPHPSQPGPARGVQSSVLDRPADKVPPQTGPKPGRSPREEPPVDYS